MIFDLGAVLSALITAGIAAAATFVTTMSPSDRRIKRLERLVEVRSRVDAPASTKLLDYAIDSLSYQIAEDAKHLGNRAGSRMLGFAILTMSSGLFQIVYTYAAKPDLPSWSGWMGAVLFILGFFGIVLAMTWVPETTEKKVREKFGEPS